MGDDKSIKSAAEKSIGSRIHYTPSEAGSYGNGTLYESSNDGSGITPPLPKHIYHAPEVAKKEDGFIQRAKVLVGAALLIAVVAVAISTYMLVSNQEQEAFENQVCRKSLSNSAVTSETPLLINASSSLVKHPKLQPWLDKG